MLGASGWQVFWHVTLPNITWGLLYGAILCNARAMGEFGAVSVISGHIRGLTNTMPAACGDSLQRIPDSGGDSPLPRCWPCWPLVTLAIKTVVEWRHTHAWQLLERRRSAAESAGASRDRGARGSRQRYRRRVAR